MYFSDTPKQIIMERIKFFQDETPVKKTKSGSDIEIHFNEIKKFISDADNFSFDQIKFRQKSHLNKIVIDIVTGIQYPAYNEFIKKIEHSKYAGYFDLR